MSDSEHPLAKAALADVVNLHVALEAWLGGTAPESDAGFAPIEAALAEGFTIVSPDGSRAGRAEIVAGLRASHGAKARKGAFRITIRENALLHLAPPLAAVGYIEEQEIAGAVSRRRSTALFGPSAAAPGRVQWLTLHETWIEGEGGGE